MIKPLKRKTILIGLQDLPLNSYVTCRTYIITVIDQSPLTLEEPCRVDYLKLKIVFLP